MMITQEDINKPCEYTSRSGRVEYGTVKSVIAMVKQVDFAKYGGHREHFYVPFDMIKLLSEEELVVLRAAGLVPSVQQSD